MAKIKVDDDQRQAILTAAARLFGEKGFSGTSTREIARSVGLQQSSLFHYFPSKNSILDELLEYSLDGPVRHAQALAAADGSPAARLYRYLYDDTAFLYGSPYDLSGVYADEVVNDPAFSPWMRRRAQLHKSVRKMIRQGIDAHEFITIDPSFAQMLISSMNHMNLKRAAAGRRRPVEVVATESTDFVLRGLLVDPQRLDSVREAARSIAGTGTTEELS